MLFEHSIQCLAEESRLTPISRSA